jgi:hypothetical protein
LFGLRGKIWSVDEERQLRLLVEEGKGEGDFSTCWFLQFFLLPNYGILAYPGNVISFVAEISLMLWLLIMVVKEQK